MLTKLIGKLALFCTIIVKNVALLGQSNLFFDVCSYLWHAIVENEFYQ